MKISIIILSFGLLFLTSSSSLNFAENNLIGDQTEQRTLFVLKYRKLYGKLEIFDPKKKVISKFLIGKRGKSSIFAIDRSFDTIVAKFNGNSDTIINPHHYKFVYIYLTKEKVTLGVEEKMYFNR